MNHAADRRGVLCVGRAYCDLIFTGLPRFPSLGTEVFAGGLGLRTGGGAPITAAHLAQLGRPSALAAVLPVAPFASVLEGELTAVGVDLSLSQAAPPGSDLQATVAITGEGDRAFLTRRAGPPAAMPDRTALDRQQIGHIHVSEVTSLLEMPGLVALARETGATLSLDCAWDDDLDPFQVAPLIAAVDVFLPNAEEAEQLTRLGLALSHAPLTVVKDGASGARAETTDGTVHVPAQTATVVDTTGAGDAFNAGFLDAWLGGAPLSDCLTAGNSAGARAVAVRGGFPLPEAAGQ